jgi:hypothetical protein
MKAFIIPFTTISDFQLNIEVKSKIRDVRTNLLTLSAFYTQPTPDLNHAQEQSGFIRHHF